MNEFLIRELNKILTMLQNVDFYSNDGHIKKANQNNVNQAYSNLFDIIKIIEKKQE
jgi:hypothetical protein